MQQEAVGVRELPSPFRLVVVSAGELRQLAAIGRKLADREARDPR